MKVVKQYGKDDLAVVYLARTDKGHYLEFVESLQPPFVRNEKWVLIISTLLGCPVGCIMCDAGGSFKGKISTDEMFAQIDYVIKKRFNNGKIPVKKFKIQFSRMGEPAFNDDVLKVLDEFPTRYEAPGFIPSLSTVGPAKREEFFEKLLDIKKRLYSQSFQLQFSIHSTDQTERDMIIPVKKWSFGKIADYAARFYDARGRKITLNFILAKDFTLDVEVLRKTFSPEIFFIKMTPLNPTYTADRNKLAPGIIGRPIESGEGKRILEKVKSVGYDAILSIGEQEENKIGSNCGQFVETYVRASENEKHLEDSYDTFSYDTKEKRILKERPMEDRCRL